MLLSGIFGNVFLGFSVSQVGMWVLFNNVVNVNMLGYVCILFNFVVCNVGGMVMGVQVNGIICIVD